MTQRLSLSTWQGAWGWAGSRDIGTSTAKSCATPTLPDSRTQAQQAHHLGKMKGVNKVSSEFISNTDVGQTGMRVPPRMKNWKQQGWSHLASSQNRRWGSRCLLWLLQCPHPLEEQYRSPNPSWAAHTHQLSWTVILPMAVSGHSLRWSPSPPPQVAPVRVSSDLHMTKSLSAVSGA